MYQKDLEIIAAARRAADIHVSQAEGAARDLRMDALMRGGIGATITSASFPESLRQSFRSAMHTADETIARYAGKDAIYYHAEFKNIITSVEFSFLRIYEEGVRSFGYGSRDNQNVRDFAFTLKLDGQGFAEDFSLAHSRKAGADRLNVALASLSPELPKMRRGSWEALRGTNEDAHRHAAHSSRELLSQVLALLVPEVEGETKPSRRSRFKVAIGMRPSGFSDSDVEVAESSAKLADAIYAKLSSIAHGRSNHSDVEPILKLTDTVLELLLF